MKIGPDDPFWVVVDAKPKSEIGDVLFECSIRGLDLQFKGGLKMEENPTIFTDRAEAEREAQKRLLVRKVMAAMAAGTMDPPKDGVKRIQMLDGAGAVVWEAEV